MRFKRFLNIHTLLLLVLVVTAVGIIFRFLNWGKLVDLNEIFKDTPTEVKAENFDFFLPVVDSEGNIVSSKDISTIVCFGNAPFADDRGSDTNLANIIAKKTGLTVYNCSIGGSYLTVEDDKFNSHDHPWDSYNFYWLAHVACHGEVYHHLADSSAVLGDANPPEAEEVYNTLWNLDFNEVDVVVIMYDASDYLAGRGMFNDANSTDVTCFTGNLEAGIELLQDNFPNLRIIVMSPTYAYAVDPDGNYISSDKYTYGEQDVLSTYVIKQSGSCFARGVTFIDHLYGTIHSDNASEYLIDNLHLNTAGRELVADRLIEALYYFN